MARKIKLTNRAESKFGAIIFYIEANFDFLVAKKFVKRTYAFFDIVIDFPQIGLIEDHGKGIYGFVLAKQVTVYYRFTEKEVVILNFFDTRMRPSKRG